jgi:hypothetical protein
LFSNRTVVDVAKPIIKHILHGLTSRLGSVKWFIARHVKTSIWGWVFTIYGNIRDGLFGLHGFTTLVLTSRQTTPSFSLALDLFTEGAPLVLHNGFWGWDQVVELKGKKDTTYNT